MQVATARAERERETTFGVIGKIAAEMLPILKNSMEGLMYAVFPFVGLAILFPNGWRAFGYYARMLIWIGLWPVAFALIHYSMTYFGSFAVQKVVAYYDFSGNLVPARYDMYSQMGIKQVMEKYEAIAGYMLGMIPMMTYVMVSQGGAMMAGMLGRVLDGYAAPAASASMEASAGNFNIGNTNFQNQSAFQHMSAPTQTAGYYQNQDGGFTTTTSQYGSVYNQNVSSLGVSVSSQKAFEQATSQAVEQATSHVSQTSASLAEARGNAFRDAFADVRAGASTTSTGTSTQETHQNTLNQMTEIVKGSAEKFAESKNWSNEEKTSFTNDVVKNYTAGASLGFGVGGTGVNVGGSHQDSSKNSEGNANTNTQSAAKMQEFLQSDQAREGLAKINTIATSSQTSQNNTSTHSTENQHSQSFERATRAEKAHSQALQQLNAARSVRSEAESNGFNVSINETPALIDHLQKADSENWKQGVIDYGRNIDTNAKATTKQGIEDFVNQRIEQQINLAQEQANIKQAGQQAVDTLGASSIANPSNQTNSLANQAERLAGQTATTHSEQQSTLEQKRTGQQDFVEQDVNSGTARVGNASANNGNEGSYPIPPQKNKD